ncbi:hypothetical protein GGQ62_002099 [Polymorphobacter fuscus]|uniref:hypothetical protein n=1 Tax=Sandarakinorhabdus fusca TaxID=1439888 RepID=UPI0014322D0B|nr:hypothetical protein [Polymorphobacter fuscus]NJC09101.1 hypothetical protein [Polymorphobacter fuscus]
MWLWRGAFVAASATSSPFMRDPLASPMTLGYAHVNATFDRKRIIFFQFCPLQCSIAPESAANSLKTH